MSDILDDLRKWKTETRSGTADADVNVVWVSHQNELLDRAMREIQELREKLNHMRVLAGAVSKGPSYAEIAKDARHDLPMNTANDSANNG